MRVESVDNILVEGDGDATGHAGIVRVRGSRSWSPAQSGESTSPVGTLG